MGEQQSQGLAGRCQATPPSSLLLPLLSHLSRNVNSEDRNVSKNLGSCPEDMICSRRAAPWPSVGSKHLCKSGTLGPLWQAQETTASFRFSWPPQSFFKLPQTFPSQWTCPYTYPGDRLD